MSSRSLPAASSSRLGFDLHVHSCWSDGVQTVDELIAAAARKLSLISICDHDTLEAYEHLPDQTDVDILPGVEISAHQDGDSVHMLGYFASGFPAAFRERIAELARSRTERVRAGVRRLRDRGIPLRWQQFDEQVGPGVACRSHVARALLAIGLARSPRAIFTNHLRSDDFEGPPITATESIQLVRDCGGVAVWAHPRPEAVERYGDELVAAGLQGAEVFVSRRSSSRRKTVRDFAERHDLVRTGGSDHHGVSSKQRLGNFSIPWERFPEVFRNPST